ncbi:Cell division protein FtsB [Tranquillimonas rosea]|uniref:Cell division protein FtsB n=1 Tax=Tranquillimonas rosea TaxID=641238 RepID=A0A1H9TCK0_9RHOB|nr:septum formation initiator family protein [Tranquillimonas rosea]SER94891.1 Cell division protein FtsB [Tranquillimonas rosea]
MTKSTGRPAIGTVIYFALAFVLGMYFTYASVQGNYGLFRRIQIEAEIDALSADLARLEGEVAVLQNKTRRLSDAYLDLDLLDEQVRDVLGMVRSDEVVLR